MTFDKKSWERLSKAYPECAGVAYELYLRDKKKQANVLTYFNFAKKRIYESETRYNKNLYKWVRKQRPIKEENQ